MGASGIPPSDASEGGPPYGGTSAVGESLRVNPRWSSGLLVLLALVAFAPGAGGDFIWDDDAHVTASRPVTDPGGLAEIWFKPGSVPQYYPLTHTSFWLEFRLWGDRPLGYHVVNLLLHAASSVVLWRVLVGLGFRGAWLAAAFFAVHPVHAESVVWISERKNTLSGLLALSATWAWLRWWRSEPDLPASRPGRSWWVSWLLFVAAILSKTITVTVPAAWLVVAWWKGDGRLRRREWLGVLPMVLVAIPAAVMTAWIEHQHIGAGRLDLGLSPVDRLLVAGRATWFYASKLAWPVDLCFIYPRWDIDSSESWQWVFPVAVLLVLAAVVWFRRRLGRGPAAAALLFVGTLTPALGFVDAYPMQFSFVADHFQYLASIPLLSGFAYLVVTRWYATHGGVVVLILLCLSVFHSRVFVNTSVLWSDVVKKNPGSALALTSLGNELGEAGSHRLAEQRHRQAIEVDPQFPDAWVNLAVELQGQGRGDEAFEAAGRAVELAPWLPRARVNLALGLKQRGRYDEATEHLEAAVAMDHRFAIAWWHLLALRWDRGDSEGMQKALSGLRKADPRMAAEWERTRPAGDGPDPAPVTP